jgi:guanylate kinase
VLKKPGKIIIIAGPTGSGESAVTKAALRVVPRTERVVTTTTRKKRPYEKNGIDYFFVSPKYFKKMITAGEFLEYIKVPNRDVQYGTVKKQVENKLNAGINLVGNFELQGLRSYREAFPGRILGIFIRPDSLSVLKKRFVRRDPTITEREINKRLVNARREMKEAKYYDHIVLNPDGRIDFAVKQVIRLMRNFIKDNR